jgi:hypothetical protein
MLFISALSVGDHPVLVTIARLALVTAAIALFTTSFTTSADAQSVHPRCVKVKDKVKCTCFFENGGQIVDRPGGGKRAQIWSDSDGEAFARCMQRTGRPNG